MIVSLNKIISLIYYYIIETHHLPKYEQYDSSYGSYGPYACHCGKIYSSYQALTNHKNIKHPHLIDRFPLRVRGRPRKYPPKPKENEFETNKYAEFFDKPGRNFKDGDMVNIDLVVKDVYKNLYESKYCKKFLIRIRKPEENYILNNLLSKVPGSWKKKEEKTCDEIFYEYLIDFKAQTNQKFFTLMLKFVLLYRECFNLIKYRENNYQNRKYMSNILLPEELPDICNEFYNEFLDENDFFGIRNEEERNELVEIIQHFCVWLYKSEYTKSQLSLA